MRKYLASLPDKSESHKKRFALASSALITLFIFGVWSLVNFGLPTKETTTLAENNPSEMVVNEPVPLEGLFGGVANAFTAIKDSFKVVMRGGVESTKNTLESIDTANEYEELRTRALGE